MLKGLYGTEEDPSVRHIPPWSHNMSRQLYQSFAQCEPPAKNYPTSWSVTRSIGQDSKSIMMTPTGFSLSRSFSKNKPKASSIRLLLHDFYVPKRTAKRGLARLRAMSWRGSKRLQSRWAIRTWKRSNRPGGVWNLQRWQSGGEEGVKGGVSEKRTEEFWKGGLRDPGWLN